MKEQGEGVLRICRAANLIIKLIVEVLLQTALYLMKPCNFPIMHPQEPLILKGVAIKLRYR